MKRTKDVFFCGKLCEVLSQKCLKSQNKVHYFLELIEIIKVKLRNETGVAAMEALAFCK